MMLMLTKPNEKDMRGQVLEVTNQKSKGQPAREQALLVQTSAFHLELVTSAYYACAFHRECADKSTKGEGTYSNVNFKKIPFQCFSCQMKGFMILEPGIRQFSLTLWFQCCNQVFTKSCHPSEKNLRDETLWMHSVNTGQPSLRVSKGIVQTNDPCTRFLKIHLPNM